MRKTIRALMDLSRNAGLQLAAIGVALVALGLALPTQEDVTPPSAEVYVDSAQADAQAEGLDASVFTVTAPDGTTTENHIRPDDTVWGFVTTPTGEWFTFGIDEDDPEWDCQTMGNRVCGKDSL